MKELSILEVEDVSGGVRLGPILWSGAIYDLLTQGIDMLSELDWGNSMDNPDTNLAP